MPAYSLGFSTLGCPAFTLEEACSLAARHGLAALELRCAGGDILAPENFARHLPEPASFRRAAEQRGLRIVCFDTSVRFLSPDDNALETLSAFAVLADTLGARWLRIFDGGKPGVAPTETEWAAGAALLASWRARRRERGFACDLAVETHDAFKHAEAIAEFIRREPDAALIWDTHHTWGVGDSLEKTWAVAGPRIVHLHVKDSLLDAAHPKGFRLVAPGTGRFPWAELHALLARTQFAGVVTFEWERYWQKQLPPAEDVLPAFVATMRR